MCRPADGLCAKCRNLLPDEWVRNDMTEQTDICASCANTLLTILRTKPPVKAWYKAYYDRLRDTLRLKA